MREPAKMRWRDNGANLLIPFARHERQMGVIVCKMKLRNFASSHLPAPFETGRGGVCHRGELHVRQYRRNGTPPLCRRAGGRAKRSEEHTSELQSLMRISYAVFCLKKKKQRKYEPLTTKHQQPTQA